MINNASCRWGLLAVLGQASLVQGCPVVHGAQAPDFQGVIELEEASIGFELAGRLTQVAVQEGDVVEAGTLLARLDDTLERSSRSASESDLTVAKEQVDAVKAGARAEEVRSMASRVAAARATEELLEKQTARQRSLLEKGVIAQAAVDDIEGQLARSRAEREALDHTLKLLRQGSRKEDVSVVEARAQAASVALQLSDVRLLRHELRSPIRGAVLDVNFEQGEVVAAGAPVVTLADLQQPYVDVFVPQAQVSALKMGQHARVKVDALSVELGGKVEHIGRRTEFTPRYLFSEGERSTLVVRVRVRVHDPKEQLRAGVPAFVRLTGGKP